MAVPFDQLDGQIWMNGEFVPWKDAKIHVLTHGLHYASAVFEGERAYGGRVFKLTEHNQRLHDSAAIMGFKIPYTVAELDAATMETLKRQGFSDAYVRPIAWRGSEMMGVSAQANRINVAIAIWQWGSYFNPAEKLKGIKLDLAQYRRPDPMTAPGDRPHIGIGETLALQGFDRGGIKLGHAVGDLEAHDRRRIVQALVMLGQLENSATISALSFEHGARIMQAVRENVNLCIFPRQKFAVHPDPSVQLVKRNCHGVTSPATTPDLLLSDTPARTVRQDWTRSAGLKKVHRNAS
jgi:hypothetical protein